MSQDGTIKLVDLLPVTADLGTPEAWNQMGLYLSDSTEVLHAKIAQGAITIECEYEEALSAPEVAKLAKQLCDEGEVDGIFVNCFGDPGVRPARELVKVPVMGGFEPAMYLALGLGDRISIVTVLDSVVPSIRNNIAKCGLTGRVASIRTLDMPVLGLHDHEQLLENIYVQSKAAVLEDGADVIVMGCTGICGIVESTRARLLEDGLDVPVLEASQCAMGLIELYARMGLYQSRHTYHEPPAKG